MTLSVPPPHPVLWEVQGPGETVWHTTLARTAFEAGAKRGLLMSECRVERTKMLEPSMNPLRALVPVKHRWRALNGLRVPERLNF